MLKRQKEQGAHFDQASQASETVNETATPWLGQYPADVPKSAGIVPRRLCDYLDENAVLVPDRDHIHHGSLSWTYKETALLTAKASGLLASLGVEKGERVGLCLPPHPAYCVFAFATWRRGAMIVGMNPIYAEPTLVHQAKQTDPKVIVCLDVPELLAKARAMAARCGARLLVCRVDAADLKTPSVTTRAELDDEIAAGPAVFAAAPEVAVDFDPSETIAALQFTGGTTGAPKAAMLTHANLSANFQQMRAWMPMFKHGQEVALCGAPFTHIGGLSVTLIFMTAIGGKLVILQRFDPTLMLDLIDHHGVSFLVVIPTILVALLSEAKTQDMDWTRVKFVLAGAAASPIELQKRFKAVTGLEVHPAYGATETSPAAIHAPYTGRPDLEMTGLPLPDTQVSIRGVDDPAVEVASGQVGEICISGPQVFKGYWEQPEATEKAFVENYVRMGDLGRMDEAGWVTIVDRLKDIIIAGGYNIYPGQVENAIMAHPSVSEALVAGVPDDYRGETVLAAIVLREGAELLQEELDDFLKKSLSPMERPKLYTFVEALPKTEAGKLSRKLLREHWLERSEIKGEPSQDDSPVKSQTPLENDLAHARPSFFSRLFRRH